jgi:beta-N-acetylhexosaminidase
MPAVGKHFPGHGAVEVDSHLGLPVDPRHFEDIWAADILPFRSLCKTVLAGLMPAHIVYEKNDPMPAGFSPYWIQTILRERLGFQGAVLSDDLSMQGAAMMGDMTSRAEAALAAGCDMILVCNKPESAIEVIDNLSMSSDPLRYARLVRLHGRHGVERDQLLASQEWKQAVNTVLDYAPNQELELDLS